MIEVFQVAGTVLYKAVATVAIGAAITTPVAAHHSFAMFSDTNVTVSGTVKKMEWTNPHIWLWVVVDDGKGGTQTWGFEGAAPGESTRAGMTKTCVVPGDKVTVTARPLKDGRPGGSLGGLTKADGSTPCGRSGGGPGGPPPGAGGPPSTAGAEGASAK